MDSQLRDACRRLATQYDCHVMGLSNYCSWPSKAALPAKTVRRDMLSFIILLPFARGQSVACNDPNTITSARVLLATSVRSPNPSLTVGGTSEIVRHSRYHAIPPPFFMC